MAANGNLVNRRTKSRFLSEKPVREVSLKLYIEAFGHYRSHTQTNTFIPYPQVNKIYLALLVHERYIHALNS